MNKADYLTIRLAEHSDIPATRRLLERYHANTLQGEKRANGFVTTDMSVEQFAELIDIELGVTIAVDDRTSAVVALLIGASWAFLSAWPMFKYMAGILDQYKFDGKTLDPSSSYQYGPICIDEGYRGQGLGERLIQYQQELFSQRYPIMATFINKVNPRSYRFHTRSGFKDVGQFAFNNNQYWILAKHTAESSEPS